MKRTKGQTLMLPDDVHRAWAFAFYGTYDQEQGNIMCAQARNELRLLNLISPSEIAALKMKFPTLTTHDK